MAASERNMGMRTILPATVAGLLLIAIGLVLFLPGTSALADNVKAPPAPKEAINPDADAESAQVVLAGGCFWCTEHVFQNVKGVTDVVSGYAGGTAATADYEKVSMGESEHAEAIKVTYDPSQITLGEVFQVFFGPMHDATQLNYQGPDRGRQYRSAIFYANDVQKQAAESYMAQLAEAGIYDEPIVTTLEPLDAFYPAEDYHQDYVIKNPRNAYVVRYALPKIEKLKKQLPDLFDESK